MIYFIRSKTNKGEFLHDRRSWLVETTSHIEMNIIDSQTKAFDIVTISNENIKETRRRASAAGQIKQLIEVVFYWLKDTSQSSQDRLHKMMLSQEYGQTFKDIIRELIQHYAWPGQWPIVNNNSYYGRWGITDEIRSTFLKVFDKHLCVWELDLATLQHKSYPIKDFLTKKLQKLL